MVGEAFRVADAIDYQRAANRAYNRLMEQWHIEMLRGLNQEVE